jgi:hypothetical protein
MSLEAEMGRLTREFSQASKFRTSALDGMRRATKATLMECATMRGNMMHDYRVQTHKFLASLARDVAAHRRATTKQVMQVMRSRRIATAKRQKSSLDAGRRELRTDVAGFVASIRADLGVIRADLASARDIWSAFKLGDSTAAMKRKRSKGIDAKRRKNADARTV